MPGKPTSGDGPELLKMNVALLQRPCGVKPAVQFPEFMFLFEADLVRHAQEMPNPKF